MTQKPKRRNHEVAKGYLKRWVNSKNQLWVFDIETQTIESRSLEAGFAIRDYLYVPEINGQRVDAAEDWFSGAENELINFIARLERRDFTTPIKQQHLYLTLLGLIGFSLRSAYDMRGIEDALVANASLGEKIGTDLSDEQKRHRFLVENMVAKIDQQARRFCSATVTLVFGTSNRLLVCDRPGADLAVLEGGMTFIPVGPHDYVFMDLSNTIAPALTSGVTFAQSGSDDSFTQSINEHTIKRARHWIVAETEAELKAIADELTLEKIEARRQKDRVSFEPLSEEQRRNGLRLRDPKI